MFLHLHRLIHWQSCMLMYVCIYIRLLMTVTGAEASKACMHVLQLCHFLLDVVDHSRVILKVPDETGCDYINASYINVSICV